jgi:hypothetical protein
MRGRRGKPAHRQLLAGHLVELFRHADIKSAGDRGDIFGRGMSMWHDLVTRRHLQTDEVASRFRGITGDDGERGSWTRGPAVAAVTIARIPPRGNRLCLPGRYLVLLFVVVSLVGVLLPTRIRHGCGDGSRFTVFRYGDGASYDGLAIFHQGQVVSAIVHRIIDR